MAVYNKEAVRFLLETYNVNKVILSREVTLKEIESIVTEFPNTFFEVFGE
jgi:collagenase-like PrtC family protease